MEEKKRKKSDYTIIFLFILVVCLVLVDLYLIKDYFKYKQNISNLNRNYSAISTGISKLQALRSSVSESIKGEKASKLLTFLEQVAKKQGISYQASPIEVKHDKAGIIEVGYRLVFKEVVISSFVNFVYEVQKQLPYIKTNEFNLDGADAEGTARTASVSLVYFKRIR